MNEQVVYKIKLQRGESLIEALRNVPSNATHLDLSSNSLGELATEDLIEAFAVLPANLVSIDLSDNKLFNKSGAELKRIFEALPATLNAINLSKNELGNRSGFGLGGAFAGLPVDLRFIDLSHNFLGKKSAAELKRVFEGFSTELHSINLSGNSLLKRAKDKLDLIELDLIWSSLPANVQSIYLLDNDKIKRSQLAQICFLSPCSLNQLFLNESSIEKEELAILKAEGGLFNCINIEIERLHDNRGINALRNIKKWFNKDLSHNGMTAVELKEKWDYWKVENQAIINKKRNKIYSFYKPNHKTKIQLAVEKITFLMDQVIAAMKKEFNDCPHAMKPAQRTL